MKTLKLEVFAREETGKGAARKLRREGLIPAVIYGEKSIKSLTVRMKDLQQVLKTEAGSHALLEVTVDGKKKTALLKDVQHDPILQVPIHADIFVVSMDKKIKIMVEVKSVGGEPAGLKKGGILTHALTEVEVECLPLEIPDAFKVDLSSLDVGDSFHVSDLPSAGVKVLTQGDQVLYNVVAPTVEKAVEEEVEEVAEVEGAAAEEVEGTPPESDKKSEPKSKE